MRKKISKTDDTRPKRKEFLIFGNPMVEEEEIREVEKTLRSGWLGTGHKVARFEEMFKEYIGSKYAMALSSCTAALHLSMLALGIKHGDEVITTPMTFCATVNAIIHGGARPVFVDVERQTMNIDPHLIEGAITPRSRAIIPVHFAGRPCDMDTIMDVAKRHNLKVVEDAAHCIEGTYNGRKIGNIGDLACFSFYVTKNIITGEGGMVTTNNKKWADKIKMYSLHGLSQDAWRRYSDKGFKHYKVVLPGFKYNMMDIQAAIGIHQLPRIERYLRKRWQIWQRYDEAFRDLPVITPAKPEPGIKHAMHLYTLLLDIDRLKADRDSIQQALYRENIGTGIHYVALHLHPYYARAYKYRRGDFPNAEYISERTISLPLSAKLTDRDAQDIVRAVSKVVLEYTKR